MHDGGVELSQLRAPCDRPSCRKADPHNPKAEPSAPRGRGYENFERRKELLELWAGEEALEGCEMHQRSLKFHKFCLVDATMIRQIDMDDYVIVRGKCWIAVEDACLG